MTTSLDLVGVLASWKTAAASEAFLDRNNNDFYCFFTHKVCVEYTYSAVASNRAYHW